MLPSKERVASMKQPFSVIELSAGTSIKIVPYQTIRIVIINDVHVPFHDPQAISLCLQVIKSVTPDIIIINGDFIDFFAISRFDRSPQRKLMLGEEIKEARKVLQQFKFQCDPHKWIFLMGNHEERLRHYLWTKAPELSSLEELHVANLLGLTDGDWIVLDYTDTPQPVGYDVVPTVHFPELFITHGDKIRMSGNTVNLARSIFLKVLRNFVVGHWHRADTYIQMDYQGKSRGGWVVPCLCYQRPHWDSGRIWNQGLAVVEMNQRGFFKVDIVSFIRENGSILAFWNGKEFSVKLKEANKA
jgi:predicted phosphodiesterase